LKRKAISSVNLDRPTRSSRCWRAGLTKPSQQPDAISDIFHVKSSAFRGLELKTLEPIVEKQPGRDTFRPLPESSGRATDISELSSSLDVHMRHVIAFLRDERAATAMEYGLIAAAIAVAIIPVLTGVGSKVKAVFTVLSTALK
jgi:pilus assembly protein Flp/PilA